MITTPEDYVAISELMARYCLTLDLDDVEAWVALFTRDARYEVYGRSFDHARTTRNLLFIERGDGVARSAVYTDELRRTGDGWRIAATRCRFIVADGLRDRPAI